MKTSMIVYDILVNISSSCELYYNIFVAKWQQIQRKNNQFETNGLTERMSIDILIVRKSAVMAAFIFI